MRANTQSVSLEKKIFRSDERYASDQEMPDSINVTKHAWIDLMPRRYFLRPRPH